MGNPQPTPMIKMLKLRGALSEKWTLKKKWRLNSVIIPWKIREIKGPEGDSGGNRTNEAERESQRDLKCDKDYNHCCWLWEWRNMAMSQRMWVSSRSWEQPLVNHKETSVLKLQETESYQYLEGAWKWIVSQARKQLDFGLMRSGAEKQDKPAIFFIYRTVRYSEFMQF